MKNKLKQLNDLIIFVLLVFIFLLLSFNLFKRGYQRFATDFIYPYVVAPVKATDLMAQKTLLFKSKSSLLNAYFSLKKENENLKFKLLQENDCRAENASLRRFAGLKEKVNFDLVAAVIILRDPYNYNQSFLISKGSSSGISKGALVVTFDKNRRLILAGKVREANRYSSIVDTLNSASCRISVKISDGQYPALFQGYNDYRGESGLLKFIALDARLNNGDEVLSAGFSPSVPALIPLGRVVNIRENDDSMYLIADMKPYCDFNRLKFVYVIIAR